MNQHRQRIMNRHKQRMRLMQIRQTRFVLFLYSLIALFVFFNLHEQGNALAHLPYGFTLSGLLTHVAGILSAITLGRLLLVICRKRPASAEHVPAK